MKHYTKDNFDITESVGFLITKARNVLTQKLDAALKGFDITGPQMGIILSLKRGNATTPFELSKFLSIDTGLMTRMLDKLEKAGLLERSRSQEDRRVVLLNLTEKGLEVADHIIELAPDVLNERLKQFTKAEFEELQRLLKKFASA
ncbi:MarR family transcriptional regulator, multiple antibiotic resistance protein MarR [Pararobbsia alpina]|uniref:MarR family winged helix-turn-helix transcriptional regulator n=1 Tax=Pararobbsia alpina TaxID=621374 RepID=UPI0039A57153